MKKVKTILKESIESFLKKEVSKRSASLTYYLIFAIFPFMISVISLLGFLHLPMISLEGEAAGFLPEDVIRLLNLPIAHMTESSNGAILTFGVVFSFWFPYRAVRNLTDAVSDIYGDEKPIGHTKRVILLSLIILILIPAMLVLMIIGPQPGGAIFPHHKGIHLHLDKSPFSAHGGGSHPADLCHLLFLPKSAPGVEIHPSRRGSFHCPLDGLFRRFFLLCG